MNIHKNARTTPRSRGQIVARVVSQQESPATVATAVGVSERTVRKWVARYAAEAEAGLADRPCRPHRRPGATPPLLVSWVAQLRRQRWTGAEIAQALQLSASTVARLLRRQGLARLRALEPPVPVQRYEWARPGELVHLDVKKLGRIGRVGHRISGDRRSRVRGIGWEYVHVAIDDASRLAYVEVLRDEGGVTTTQFWWRARAWFRRLHPVCPPLPQPGRAPPPHAPLHPAHEWQGRALHPDPPARVGVPPGLPELAPPHRGPARLAVLLPLGARPWRPPRSTTHQWPRTISWRFTTSCRYLRAPRPASVRGRRCFKHCSSIGSIAHPSGPAPRSAIHLRAPHGTGQLLAGETYPINSGGSNGIRTRVCCPPRAFLISSGS